MHIGLQMHFKACTRLQMSIACVSLSPLQLCDSREHNAVKNLAIVAILVYPVG